MKKFISFVLVLSFTILFLETFTYADDQPIRVYYQTYKILFDVQPQVIENRTLIPIRAVGQAMDLDVNFDAETNSVTVKNKDGSKKIQLKINSNEVNINDKIENIDIPAKIIDGRTLIPIRFISEKMGLSVVWDAKKRVIFINSGDSFIKNFPDIEAPIDLGLTRFQSSKTYMTDIQINSIGTPELILAATNITNKDIESFEFETTFYNTFNEVVYKIGTKDSTFKGIVQDANLPKAELNKNIKQGNNFNVYNFNLVLYENAHNVYPWDCKVIRVKFKDGSIWTRP